MTRATCKYGRRLAKPGMPEGWSFRQRGWKLQPLWDVDDNLRKVRSSSSRGSFGLGNACYLLYENIDPHGLGAALLMERMYVVLEPLLAVVIDPAPRPPSALPGISISLDDLSIMRFLRT